MYKTITQSSFLLVGPSIFNCPSFELRNLKYRQFRLGLCNRLKQQVASGLFAILNIGLPITKKYQTYILIMVYF